MFNFGKKKPVPIYAFKERVPAQRATVKEHNFGGVTKAVTYELEVNTPEAAQAVTAVVRSLADIAKHNDCMNVATHAAFIHGTLCGYEGSGVLAKEVADNLNDLVERVTKDKLDAIKRREAKHGNNEKVKEAGKEEPARADEERSEADKSEE